MTTPTVTGIVHGVLGFGVPLFSVASAWNPATRQGKWAAWAAGACAAVVVALGVARQHAWEANVRRSVVLASRSAGAGLDSKEHLGVAAACFALCACACAGEPRMEDPRVQRAASVAAAVFALLAFTHLAFAHARVPLALVE